MPLLAVTWPPPTFTAVTSVGVVAPSSLRMVPVAAAVPMVVPGARVGQRHGESFVGFDRGVARHIHGDGLAGLAGGKAHRPGREGTAGEVRSRRRVGAAAGHGIACRRRAGRGAGARPP